MVIRNLNSQISKFRFGVRRNVPLQYKVVYIKSVQGLFIFLDFFLFFPALSALTTFSDGPGGYNKPKSIVVIVPCLEWRPV